MTNNYILITIGDIDGIGIEILINLFKKKKINNFILLTSETIFKNYLKINKVKLKIKKVDNLKNINILKNDKKFLFFNIFAKNKVENTYKSLISSYNIIKLYNFKGIINLPINKQKIIKNIDKNFVGQTEFYQKIDNKKNSNMMFIYKDLIITTLTTHIALSSIKRKISRKKFIFDKIKCLNKVLENKFKIEEPLIAISGLNPHSSENGTIGNDEAEYMIPQIKMLNKINIRVQGPFSADSILNVKNINKYKCFVFCYHDQALIPYKYISKNRGVNFTGGLSFIRTSLDHGTAYEIVGKNIAENKSLFNCFKLIKKMKS